MLTPLLSQTLILRISSSPFLLQWLPRRGQLWPVITIVFWFLDGVGTWENELNML